MGYVPSCSSAIRNGCELPPPSNPSVFPVFNARLGNAKVLTFLGWPRRQVCLWIIPVPSLEESLADSLSFLIHSSTVISAIHILRFSFFLINLHNLELIHLHNLELILFSGCMSCLHLSENINYALLKSSGAFSVNSESLARSSCDCFCFLSLMELAFSCGSVMPECKSSL